jgi:hypothetical protein
MVDRYGRSRLGSLLERVFLNLPGHSRDQPNAFPDALVEGSKALSAWACRIRPPSDTPIFVCAPGFYGLMGSDDAMEAVTEVVVLVPSTWARQASLTAIFEGGALVGPRLEACPRGVTRRIAEATVRRLRRPLSEPSGAASTRRFATTLAARSRRRPEITERGFSIAPAWRRPGRATRGCRRPSPRILIRNLRTSRSAAC